MLVRIIVLYFTLAPLCGCDILKLGDDRHVDTQSQLYFTLSEVALFKCLETQCEERVQFRFVGGASLIEAIGNRTLENSDRTTPIEIH